MDSIEGKQLDMYKSNVIFCHVECFCLQEREDEARSIFLFLILRRPPQQ